MSMSTREVRAKLSRYSGTTLCAVRDVLAGTVVWHVLAADELLHQLTPAEEPALCEVMDRKAHRAGVYRAGTRNGPGPHFKYVVVLDGTEMIGILRGDRSDLIPGFYRDWTPMLDAKAIDPRKTKLVVWPSLAAPPTALPGDKFALTVSLSRERIAAMPRLRLSLQDELELQVDVAAVGLDAPGGWRYVLHIERTGEVSSLSIPLRVRADATLGPMLIHVAFLKDGVVCGNATCALTIGTDAVALPGRSSPCVVPAAAQEPVDLLVMIRKADGNSATGRYIWSMTSTRVVVDERPFPIDLGDDAQTFARAVMQDVVYNDDTALLEPVLKSIGRDIAAHIPPAFWDALRTIAATLVPHEGPPCLLIDSAEEFVPWELALMDRPLDDGPPYLGAQTSLGRWLYSQSGLIPASPPSSISVKDVAVLAPDYDESTDLPRLPAAMAEARHMVDAYGAIAVEATEDDMRRLLDAQVARADGSAAEITVVHFACHADGDPTRPGDAGLYLVSGRRVSPRIFGASTLGTKFGPLLFINACEAGVAQRLLAQTAGFAGISLRGGFRGFIAPMWSVEDTTASEIAHRFYGATLNDDALTVGQAMRDVRRSFARDRQSTALSYVFYGHPRLSLRMEQSSRAKTEA